MRSTGVKVFHSLQQLFGCLDRLGTPQRTPAPTRENELDV